MYLGFEERKKVFRKQSTKQFRKQNSANFLEKFLLWGPRGTLLTDFFCSLSKIWGFEKGTNVYYPLDSALARA